jgi:hypothetical protein
LTLVPGTDPPRAGGRAGRIAAVVILLGVEGIVTVRSHEVGITLLALTVILLLTAYTFRPSRPPPPPGADPGGANPDN